MLQAQNHKIKELNFLINQITEKDEKIFRKIEDNIQNYQEEQNNGQNSLNEQLQNIGLKFDFICNQLENL